MTRIDPTVQWSALLRARLEQMGRPRPDGSPASAKAAEPERGAREPGAGAASANSRLRAIRHDDPERRRKAFRIFMEATLRDEFGRLLQDPADFDGLVEQVTAQMYADPDLRSACDAAADALLEASAQT
ncbi:hypothetical protein [Paracidovorax oryzae]|uniref:hypothetical protein n=1 Tax=Paracidovorax oryzae TaxID=862720 RepID=UPI0012ECA20F|nr:hypothetical protein [Paracidovorax oryzae]